MRKRSCDVIKAQLTVSPYYGQMTWVSISNIATWHSTFRSTTTMARLGLAIVASVKVAMWETDSPRHDKATWPYCRHD